MDKIKLKIFSSHGKSNWREDEINTFIKNNVKEIISTQAIQRFMFKDRTPFIDLYIFYKEL